LDRKHNKLMTDLHRLLSTQDFKSTEEINEFLAQFTGQPIPSLPPETLTDEEQAQDMVFAAYNETPEKGRELVEDALLLDPDCIEAFEYLAEQEMTPEIAIAFLEKGINIGRTKFGGEFLKENIGHFWAIHETRPFMRCLQNYGDCLYYIGKVEESISVMEEIIKLNPNDNQGIRNFLSLRLIETQAWKKFEKYDKMFNEDAFAFPTYNRALVRFATEGATPRSNSLLKKAINSNKYVVTTLLAKKPPKEIPAQYRPGQKDEADYYAIFARTIWMEIEGALDWLKKVSGKDSK
jgi:tetratricopeptide (TPR) repeat protein